MVCRTLSLIGLGLRVVQADLRGFAAPPSSRAGLHGSVGATAPAEVQGMHPAVDTSGFQPDLGGSGWNSATVVLGLGVGVAAALVRTNRGSRRRAAKRSVVAVA